ncbi:MAG: DUF4250 domain-containing protein [Clostridia bacterium]|nr:DUF4250 domain-containing protein [Clostridia bacterium]
MDLLGDAYILLSVVNTKLRDTFSSLEDLCYDEGIPCEELTAKFAAIGYKYDRAANAFKPE